MGLVYITFYLLIGGAFAIYLPLMRARTIDRIKNVDSVRYAQMSKDERVLFHSVSDSMATPYKTWQIAVAGLLWPTQVVAWIVAHVMWWIHDMRNHDH